MKIRAVSVMSMLAAIVLIALPACRAGSPSGCCSDVQTSVKVKGGAVANLTSLSDSLDPLRDHFNANKDRHRFVALLSPT